MDEQEHLVLSAALLPPQAAFKAWEQFRATVALREASPILMWAGGYIHENLSHAGLSERYLRGIYQHNLIVNAELLQATRECVSELSRKFEVTRLKTFGRAAIRKKLGSRPLADIDILIEPRFLKQAIAILARHGFSPSLDVTTEEFWDRIVPQRSSWGFINDFGKSIDIHWSLFDHLDKAANRKLISGRSSSNWHGSNVEGVLDPALELALLAIQHRLQFPSAGHLLIEIFRLQEETVFPRIIEVGKQSQSLEWIHEAFDQLAPILGKASPIIARLNQHRTDNPLSPLQHDTQGEIDFKTEKRLVSSFGKRGKWKTWLLFSWWVQGTSSRTERGLIRVFRGLSGSRVSEVSPGVWRFDSSTKKSIGPGWSYRMPDRDFFWSRFPEGRLAFIGAGKGTFELEIQVEWDEWGRHPLQEVTLFVNGVEAQIIRKSTQHIRFQLENRMSTLEISVRRIDRKHFSTAGIFREWYEQMLPVKSISLYRVSGIS